MIERTVQSDVATVRYWVLEKPNAPWLVATNGAGLDHRSFSSLASHLQEKFQVLLWDIPGHGDSQPLRGKFTLDHTVTALERILDVEGITSAVFLGFSFGGLVHQLLALRRPSVFKAMILYACLCPSIKRIPIPRWLAPVLIWAIFARPSWDSARAYFAKQCTIREDVAQEISASLERTGRNTFIAAAREMMLAATRSIPVRWEAPTLFIYGALDAHYENFRGMLNELRRILPHAVITSIEGLAHCAHSEDLGAFNRALNPFLQDL